MKQIRRAAFLLVMVILLGTGGLVLQLNRIYIQQQQSRLADKGQFFQREFSATARVTTTKLKQLQEQTHVKVAVFDARNHLLFPAGGPHADLIDSVIEFQAKPNAGKSEQLRVAGHSQTAYLFRQKPLTFVLYTPQQNLWQPFWWQGAALLGALCGLAGLSGLIFAGYVYWERRSLRRVQQQLRQVGKKQPPAPVLLKPSDHYYALEQTIAQVNQQFQAQVALAKNERRNFTRFIDHLTIGVLLLDIQGQVIAHNAAAAKMLDQTISRVPHSYLNDVHDFTLSRLIKQAFAAEKSQHAAIKLVPEPERYLDVNVVWMKRQTVTSTYQVAVLLYDMTAVKQIQQMQLDFVSNVSHELKTPVTSISGFAETLLAGAQDDPKARQEFLEIINTESKRLAALIQDIIALSRGQQQPARLETVALRPTIEKLLVPLQQTIQQKQIHVQLNVAQSAKLMTDRQKFEQIVKNLIINALVYNRTAGQLTITAYLQKNGWQLDFNDTGLGIGADDQKRIFERFYRVDKARSRHQGGTGLGLAIVHNLVTILGGKIQVTSQLGVGSTFSLYFPEKPQAVKLTKN